MQCHLARRSPKLPSWFPRKPRFALRNVATYDFVVVGGGAAGAPFVFSMVQVAGGLPEVVVIFFLRKDYPSLQPIAKAPENGWLEYFLVSFWGLAYFQVFSTVSFRECN